MRIEETYMEAVQRTKIIELRCDLCGRLGKNEGWNDDAFHVDETDVELSVTVAHETGSSFPDSRSTTKYVVDICPQCFRDKLVPWLQSQGAKIEPIDIEF